MQRPIGQDELSIFYSSVGKAVWQIQYLEHALVTFVVIKRHKRKPTSVEIGYERLSKERKGTLGTIYGRAKDEEIIPKELDTRFKLLIEERNWLIHDARTSNSEDLYNDEKTELIIDRIQSITKESIALMHVVWKLLEEFMSLEGFNLDDAKKKADMYIKGLQSA